MDSIIICSLLWYYEHVQMTEAHHYYNNSTFPLMAHWNESRCKLRDKYDDCNGRGSGKIIMKLFMPKIEEQFVKRERTKGYINTDLPQKRKNVKPRSNVNSRRSKPPTGRFEKATSKQFPNKEKVETKPFKPTIPQEAVDIFARRMNALERTVRRMEDELKRRLPRIEDMLMELLKKSNGKDHFETSPPKKDCPSKDQPESDNQDYFIPDLNSEWSKQVKEETLKNTTFTKKTSEKIHKVKSSSNAEQVKEKNLGDAKLNASSSSEKSKDDKAKASMSSFPHKTDDVKENDIKSNPSSYKKEMKDNEFMFPRPSSPAPSTNPSFLLTTKENMCLEYASKYITDKSKILVDIRGTRITGEQLAHVNHLGRWLNDLVIDAYIYLLAYRLTLSDDNTKRIRYKSAFEYHKIRTMCIDADNNISISAPTLMRWAKKGKELLDSDMVFFPINPGAHWYVVVMRIDSEDFQVLDSIKKSKSWYTTEYSEGGGAAKRGI